MFKVIPIILTLALSGCTTSSANKAHPKALRMDKPDYPFYAAKNHIEGKVQFFYDVDAQGKVSEMRIVQSTPDHLFDDAVIRAVNKWRFEKGHPAKNIQMNVVMRVSPPPNISDSML